MLFLGPSDLAQSLGHSGNPDHPDVEQALRDIIGQVRGRCAISMASHDPMHPEAVTKWWTEGVHGFLVSSTHPLRQTFENLYAKVVTESSKH